MSKRNEESCLNGNISRSLQSKVYFVGEGVRKHKVSSELKS